MLADRTDQNIHHSELEVPTSEGAFTLAPRSALLNAENSFFEVGGGPSLARPSEVSPGALGHGGKSEGLVNSVVAN
jgi:hypothetical protein